MGGGECPLVAASVATLGHVRGRGPMDTSSAKQDEVDIGRDGADEVGGTEPRPRGFPPLTETARHPAAGQAAESRQGLRRKQAGGGAEEGDGRKKGRAETVGERFPPVFIKCQTLLKQDLWLIFYFEIILGNRP